jgi:hypothetical protein
MKYLVSEHDPIDNMSEAELRSLARSLFGKLTEMTNVVEQLLASQKIAEEERRVLMKLKKYANPILACFASACRKGYVPGTGCLYIFCM